MIELPAVFERSPWGAVVVRGDDATAFLQAVVSQDLDPVGVGETVASLLLHPQGKLDVAFRATRLGPQEWLLDTEPDHASRLVDGLTRFRIRVDAEITDHRASSAVASVIGRGDVVVPDALRALPTRWGDHEGIDVLGERVAIAEWVASSGLRVGTPAEFEVLRIEAGRPRLGVDVDDSTIPQEAFLEQDAVSFTKGCFIGQELVCRIDARGRVNRFLRRLVLPGRDAPPAGAPVHAGDREVGRITSAVAVPDEDRVVALGMIRREVEPPADVTVAVDGRPVPARVIA